MTNVLPIDSILNDFLDTYSKQNNIIILATPGAGKTTRLAPALVAKNLVPKNKKILMLQPRRLAAKAVAARIAEEREWTLGKEVGYQVRFEKCLGPETQLLVMTEGILSRKMLEDPNLEDVACVILDEFHERSIHSDLAIALLKELQSAFRPDLRIVVMSATLESQALVSYLPDAKLLQAQGRVFPVEILNQPKVDRRSYVKRLDEQVFEALSFLIAHPGDDGGNFLVFLAGVGDIKRSLDFLKAKAQFKNFEILELHGSLSLQEQSKVLKPSKIRRIILTTNIAETSLTVPGVTTVVDSGWAKVARWDASRGIDNLDLNRISLASAKQRAGRAGREKSGRVYRLWSLDEERGFKAYEDAELQRIDLASTLLTLAAWGVRDFENFDWFERPSATRLSLSLKELTNIGAIDKEKHLTELGRQLQRVPLNPRLALALLKAKETQQEEHMAFALAVLSEKDPQMNSASLDSSVETECDLEGKVLALEEIYRGANPSQWGMDSSTSRRCLKLAEELLRSVENIKLKGPQALQPRVKKTLSELLFVSFSDRLCRRREKGSPRAVMSGGRGVVLSPESEVQKAEFFLALEIMDVNASAESRVLRATALSREQLKQLAGKEINENVQADFDLKTFKVQCYRTVTYRDLVIEGPFLVSAKEMSENSTFENIAQNVLKKWPEFCARFEALAELELRCLYLQKYCPGLNVESLSDEVKLNFIHAVIEHTRQSSVDSFDVGSLIDVFCSKQFLDVLNKNAPSMLRVPSGRDIRLHYSEDLESVKCKVKLQELFGLAKSPTILEGKIEIIFDLLSPAQRPVQTTRDLASFWKNTYPELRAQLKIRYPRHPWPEDPWTAQATHKTKKALLK